MNRYGLTLYCKKCQAVSATFYFATEENQVTINLPSIEKYVRYNNGLCMACRYKLPRFYVPGMDRI